MVYEYGACSSQFGLLVCVMQPMSASCYPGKQSYEKAMPMDPENVVLVQTSFERLLPSLEPTVGLFVERLGELDLVLEYVEFALGYEGDTIGALLAQIVTNIHCLDCLHPTFERIRQATDTTTIEQHYLTVGVALLWALEQALSDSFTPETRLAWLEAYTTVVARVQATTEVRTL